MTKQNPSEHLLSILSIPVNLFNGIGPASLMREMDRKAIEDYGLPGIVLMENAGRGAFEFIREEFDPFCVSVFAGKGNNGGDGFVIARHLLNAGVPVRTFLLARKDEVKGDARTNLEILLKMKAPVAEIIDGARLDDFSSFYDQCDLIVDALLGTGLDSEVRGLYRDTIETINGLAAERPSLRVFSVDLPSGVNSDTGQVMGVAVRADATATFGMLKTGQFCHPGAELVGTLALIDISLPAELYEAVPHRLITAEVARALMPERGEDCHKGLVGHGLVLAGSPGKSGAAVMAGESALRSGAGLVTLAGPAGLHPVFEAKTLEVMTEPLPETDAGSVGERSVPRALDLCAGKTALAIGPGLGQGDEVTAFVRAMIEKSRLPMVIDADGLNAVASDPSMLKKASAPVILTPHPGEMARLSGVTTQAVLADRFTVALEFAKKRKVTLVLKGAHTLVATEEGRALVNLSGNPGMASGGTGDVLTGVILGLLCQGLTAAEAAALGVFLHGLAGDLAAEELGEEALVAGDLIRRLGPAMKQLWEEFE